MAKRGGGCLGSVLVVPTMVLVGLVSRGLRGRMTEGRQATDGDIRDALDRALTVPYTIVGSEEPSTRRKVWRARTNDGVDFTCTSWMAGTAPIPGWVWKTSCDLPIAWALARVGEFEALWRQWGPDFSQMVAGKSRGASVAVSRWEDIGPFSESITDALNNLAIPLNVDSVKLSGLSVKFSLPFVAWNIGPYMGRIMENTTGRIYFHLAGADPLDAAHLESVIRSLYAEKVGCGEWYDDTVPQDQLPGDYHGSTHVWHGGATVLTMTYDQAQGGYYVSPISLGGSSLPSYMSRESWARWARLLGGDPRRPPDQSVSDLSFSRLMWTRGGHTWTISEAIPDNWETSEPTPHGRSTTPPITATKDGAELTLSPLPLVRRDGTVVKGAWRYPIGDVEQLFGVTITLSPTNPALATLALN